MSRCTICDYLQGYGSELHDIPNRWNKRVKWRLKFNEYQCDDCYNEIKGLEWEEREFNETINPKQEDHSLPPTLSPLPIE